MEDFFNEDDLINDYIEQEEEPPWGEDEYADGPEPEGDGCGGAADADANGADAPKDGAPNGGAADAKDDAAADDDDEAEAVPRLISTSPSKPSSPLRPLRLAGDGDLHGFERYAGRSSWRTVPKAVEGAMEATGWKKKGKEGKAKNGKEEGGSDADSSDLDSDSDGKKRGRGADDGRKSRGNTNMGGEAKLVHFLEREEAAVLGRSWGTGGAVEAAGTVCAGLPTLGEDSVPVTLADGTRTFVRRGVGKKSLDEEGEAKDEKGEECLLGLPMTELVRRADILERRAARRRVEREGRRGKSADGDGGNDGDDDKDDASQNEKEESNDMDTDGEKDSAAENNEGAPDEASRKETLLQQRRRKRHHEALRLRQRLWVDKHAPSSVPHLLSDERTNREVLRALRAWDPYVFGREAPVRPAPAYPSKYGGGGDGADGWKGKGQKGQWQKKANGDEKDGGEGAHEGGARHDPRPAEDARVLLLAGPPGVGKSTLAHIACRHAGYRPIEVNASDERTGTALTERVVRAMESATLDFGGEEGRGEGGGGKGGRRGGRPNCVILDEIDGADAKASIAALVDIVRADLPPPGAKGKKGKGTATYLRRPIVLICNHKYAPALRPILPYARQFDVRPPNPERLAGRLRAVLASERLSVVAGGTLLRRLVEGTGGDVRACLHALQFASARAREVAEKKRRQREAEGTSTERDGKAAMVDISSTLMAALGGNGMKDAQGDAASTVAAVFRKSKLTKLRNPSKRQKTSRGAPSSEGGVDLVLRAVDRFGDHSKTLDCLFLNVHRVSYVDPTLDRAAAALEWLSGADTYRSTGAELTGLQRFHMPPAAAAVHLLCRVETRPDLTLTTRPLSDAHYGKEANAALARRFVEGLGPRARRGAAGGYEAVVADVVPYVPWLLSAGEGRHALSRPASSVDMLGEEERAAFEAHVATLRALGLTYVRDEGRENEGRNGVAPGGGNVRLEPEIDRLVKFEDAGDDSKGDLCRRKDVPPQLKELLAHGAAVAAMRERESDARMARQEADATASAAGTTDGKKEAATTPAAESEAKAPVREAAEKPAPAGPTPKKRPPAKAGSNTSAAKNFLGFRAAKSKQARTARRAARVGLCDRRSAGGSKKVKLSNTGSGKELSRVVRFKFQKGFTQAVRAPCQIEDLL